LEISRYFDLFDLIVTGILHVGANDGGEFKEYQELTGGPIVYVEAIPSVHERLQKRIENDRRALALQAVCSDEVGKSVRFNIANNSGLSSSMLDLGEHADLHPDIVYVSHFDSITTTVDALERDNSVIQKCNVMVIDTQGADLMILRGAESALDHMDAVVVEVSENPLYKGGASFEQIREFLCQKGYALRSLEYNALLYGDALFMRNSSRCLDIYETNKAKAAKIETSSVYVNWDGYKAVNGDRFQEFGFHSQEEDCPWWLAEFETPIFVEQVIVVDRKDYPHRSEFLIVESSMDGVSWKILGERRSHNDVKKRVFGVVCLETVKFVRLRLRDRNFMNLQQIIIL